MNSYTAINYNIIKKERNNLLISFEYYLEKDMHEKDSITDNMTTLCNAETDTLKIGNLWELASQSSYNK